MECQVLLFSTFIRYCEKCSNSEEFENLLITCPLIGHFFAYIMAICDLRSSIRGWVGGGG